MSSVSWISVFALALSIPSAAWCSPGLSEFLRLRPGMPEASVRMLLGVPQTEKSTDSEARIRTLEYSGPHALRVEIKEGVLSSATLELEKSIPTRDLQKELSVKSPGTEIQGPDSGDLKLRRKTREWKHLGIRYEEYRGNTSRVWVLSPMGVGPRK